MFRLNFQKTGGLVPAIIQDVKTKHVLMLGFMNQEALQKTTSTGFVHFWSRTRKRLWKKGETSGNTLKVMEIKTDCDNDSLLISVTHAGERICHTGKTSCFD